MVGTWCKFVIYVAELVIKVNNNNKFVFGKVRNPQTNGA